MRKSIVVVAALAAALIGTAAQAAEFEVKMLNKGAKGAMVFEPDLVHAAVGDTINFVPVDKGHDVASIKGMLPEGVEEFKSPMNKAYTLTLDKEGVYGVKCVPHYGMGMVALIVAGEPTNLKQAEEVKQVGKAKKAFAEIFKQVEGQ